MAAVSAKLSRAKITEETEESEEESDESEEETEEKSSEYDSSEDDDEDEEIHTEHLEPLNLIKFKAVDDHEVQETDQLNVKSGEILTLVKDRSDKFWEMENSSGKRGLVPFSILESFDETDPLTSSEQQTSSEEQRSGKLLWKGLRKSLYQTDATDVLVAMGAVPTGFRQSTLAKLFLEDEKFTAACALFPKLSKSALAFNDLFWDTRTSKIRAKPVPIQKLVTIIGCKHIPLPGAGLEVNSRHLRICLFDGVNVLSNIHTVKAKWDPKFPKQWTFSNQISLSTSCLEDGDLYIRTNNTTPNIGILIELCLSYVRISTGETGELSCGWVFLKLQDESGVVLQSRTYKPCLNGGTPFEQGVLVDATLSSDGISPFKAVMARLRQPRLSIKISSPGKQTKAMLDVLPLTFIGSMSLLPFVEFYRQLLADCLLQDRLTIDSADPIHSPLLTTFPGCVDEPDIMDYLRIVWADKLKIQKRSNKQNVLFMKKLFTEVYMSSAYVLHSCVVHPSFNLQDSQAMKIRKQIIQQVSGIQSDKGPLAVLLSSTIQYKPFDINDLSLDILEPHCQHTFNT